MESESGGGHFPRVFRLLGPSIPESNQRGKRNKNHMNPLIQLKKATPLFVIALVLACFTLSPQAFAGTVAHADVYPRLLLRLSPLRNVRISTPTSGATISVWGLGAAGMSCCKQHARSHLAARGHVNIFAQARKSGWTNSVVARSYTIGILTLAISSRRGEKGSII